MIRAFSIIISLIIILNLHAEEQILIAIQPLGKIHSGIAGIVKSGILRMYRAEVVVLPGAGLPDEAYYKPRERYRADILLEYLDKNFDPKYGKILGLTNKDISATKGDIYDWGIFGYGSVGGRPCVVSTFRLRKGNASEAVFRERLVKVVNHELGHNFGLNHCPVKGCLMQDAGGTVKTVDEENGNLCNRCGQKLEAVLKYK